MPDKPNAPQPATPKSTKSRAFHDRKAAPMAAEPAPVKARKKAAKKARKKAAKKARKKAAKKARKKARKNWLDESDFPIKKRPKKAAKKARTGKKRVDANA